jgi:RimJ/RimL family protein N-acetyltransferase
VRIEDYIADVKAKAPMIDLKVPVIETARLRLRGRTLEDFPFFLEMWKDPEVTRFIGGKPRGEEETWTKYLRMLGHWSVMGFGYWVIEERDSSKLVGEVGFGDFKRDMTPSIKGEPEIGWVLASFAHGKGYATEAALAAVRWGDERFGGARMSCIIEPEHFTSIRIAEKCGFKETARTRYGGDEIIVLHR